mmetsp:Transcript_3903/g.12389  ORF Transcript_3903/g.12389 Transcript_3903/m.12389 type:complete len:205 (-) Transcript_3903:578-1192(-)
MSQYKEPTTDEIPTARMTALMSSVLSRHLLFASRDSSSPICFTSGVPNDGSCTSAFTGSGTRSMRYRESASHRLEAACACSSCATASGCERACFIDPSRSTASSGSRNRFTSSAHAAASVACQLTPPGVSAPPKSPVGHEMTLVAGVRVGEAAGRADSSLCSSSSSTSAPPAPAPSSALATFIVDSSTFTSSPAPPSVVPSPLW